MTKMQGYIFGILSIEGASHYGFLSDLMALGMIIALFCDLILSKKHD